MINININIDGLILYYLKGKHDRLLDEFHKSKYFKDETTQYKLWDKVINCRNKIRRIEPEFCLGCDG